MTTFSELQHPRLKGEKTFQDFCLKLLQCDWDDPHATIHARRGQPQHGADITGSDNRNKFQNAACQCKGSEKHEWRQLSERELEDQVNLAKGFSRQHNEPSKPIAIRRLVEIALKAKGKR